MQAIRGSRRVGIGGWINRLFGSLPPLILVIIFTFFTLLFIFQTPRRTRIGFLPSSWSTQSSSSSFSSSTSSIYEENFDLPPIPSSYAAYFPDHSLPALLAQSKLSPLPQRLVAFLARPVWSHAQATERMHAHCPSSISDFLVNPDQFRGEGDFWRNNVGEEEIRSRRVSMVKWLEERLEQGYDVLGHERMKGGRGIVLTGGNQDTTLRMIQVLRHLQRLKVKLPIEVFHFSGELTDSNQRQEIETLGAKIREIHGVEKSLGAWKNFQIKGLAIVQSTFREVLYLDSDNIPLRDPSHLFEAPLYLDQGRAVFYPDLSKDHPDNAIWRLMGVDCDLVDWTFESGQIVIDKAGNQGLNLAALWLAAGMMGDRDFWFKVCGGDKDTFRWAFRALDIPFAHSPRWMSALGFANGLENGRFCGHTMLQYDLVTPPGFTRPPPLFVHANLLKHIGGHGLGRGNTFTHVKRFTLDSYSEPTLNFAKLYVYQGNGRGMCTDLDWHPNAEEGMTDEQRELQFIETVHVNDLEGKPFEGFEEAFWDEGGRVGGW